MTAQRVDDDDFTVALRLASGPEEPEMEERTNRFPVVAWWLNLDTTERVLYRGLALLSIGLYPLWPPLVLIVPGAIFAGLAVFTLLLVAWRSD